CTATPPAGATNCRPPAAAPCPIPCDEPGLIALRGWRVPHPATSAMASNAPHHRPPTLTKVTSTIVPRVLPASSAGNLLCTLGREIGRDAWPVDLLPRIRR